ncbi:TPR-like protein, partial [Armillaria gallica]
LKEEGNALFIQSNFDEALVKYTEAIELDESNAILWANRSACHLSMKRYLDSVGDSRKATELDPTYYKAWARLATAYDALKEYLPSSLAWQRALDTLPAENLTSTQEQQREEYQKRLYESTDRLH